MLKRNKLSLQEDGTYSGLRLRRADDDRPIVTKTLGDDEGLCKDQAFFHQPTMSDCSGTLIAPDLLLTAGHCIESKAICATTTVLFNYAYDAPPDDLWAPIKRINPDNVYTCKELLVRKDDFSAKLDFTIIRLDRPVTVAQPAELSHPAPTGDAFVVGHSSGLPQKLAHGTMTQSSFGLMHTADTVSGNSGGGLFDLNGNLIGVHVRGNGNRYRTRANSTCQEIVKCRAGAVNCDYQNAAVPVTRFADELTALGITIH